MGGPASRPGHVLIGVVLADHGQHRHIRDQEQALGIGLCLQRRLGAVIDCGDDCPGNDGLGLIDDGAAERAGDDADSSEEDLGFIHLR